MQIIKHGAGIVIAFFIGGILGGVRVEAEALPPLSIDVLSLSTDGGSSTHSVAEGTTLHLRGFGLYSQTRGKINFGDNIPGVTNDIDLHDDLGMGLNKFSGGGAIGLNLGSDQRLHLDVSYDGYYDFQGSKVVSAIAFNGDVFTGRVDSSARVQTGSAGISCDIWKPASMDLTLNTGLDVRVFYINAKVREELTGREDSELLWVPVPEPSLSLRWGITPNLYVRGKVAGFYAGSLASDVDASGEIGLDLNRNVGLFVGYRFWTLDFDYHDDSFDFDNSSIYAGMEVRL